MKGTEKQVAWAEEIQKRTVETLEGVVEQMKAMVAAGKGKAEMITVWENRLQTIRTFDGYAGDMIDMFKNVEGAEAQRMNAIIAAYKVNTNAKSWN